MRAALGAGRVELTGEPLDLLGLPLDPARRAAGLDLRLCELGLLAGEVLVAPAAQPRRDRRPGQPAQPLDVGGLLPGGPRGPLGLASADREPLLRLGEPPLQVAHVVVRPHRPLQLLLAHPPTVVPAPRTGS